MKIAIFGATSQIAKDLIVSFANNTDYQCFLFSRRAEAVSEWCVAVGLKGSPRILEYAQFNNDSAYDVIINFVGIGDPALAKKMGAGIFDVTYSYDLMVLDYLKDNPKTKYLFLSSGAVYGGEFSEPVDCHSKASFRINAFKETDWYGVAKLYAEARHRALSDLFIVDIRVFNYFSQTQKLQDRFLITDLIRAVQHNDVFKTSNENIVRDFITPTDFFQLVQNVLLAQPVNKAVDCYTKLPVDKKELLSFFEKKYGLEVEISNSDNLINATGTKINYFSLNREAEKFGYKPSMTSLEALQEEVSYLMVKS